MKYNVLLALAGLTMAAGALANPTPAPVPADPAKGKLIAEQICAACHGVDGNSVAAANPVLEDYLKLMELAQDINTGDPDTIAAVTMLEQVGLIAAGRAQEILNG